MCIMFSVISADAAPRSPSPRLHGRASPVNLRDTTHDLIGQVKQQTDFLVEVVPDAALATMFTVIKAGRRTLPAHVIRYNLSLEHD